MGDGRKQTLMTAGEVTEFLDREFPQMLHGGRSFHIESVGPLSARMRMVYHERHLRPGGTISGPSMFSLADVALYVAILSNIGPVDDRRVPAVQARQAPRRRGAALFGRPPRSRRKWVLIDARRVDSSSAASPAHGRSSRCALFAASIKGLVLHARTSTMATTSSSSTPTRWC
jgi:acyl-coenzyme A thioesterase PaaI-like protein